MITLLELLDGLLHGLTLLALAAALGGVGWALIVLRVPWSAAPPLAVRRALALLTAGATGVAIGQAIGVGLKVAALAEILGPGALGAFAGTGYARAAGARAALAIALAVATVGLSRAPRAPGRWAAVTLLAGLLAGSGAWLSHAAARLEDRPLLMVLTGLHQAAGALWLGGLMHAVAFWRLARRHPELGHGWPRCLRRFSALAIGSVAGLLATATPLVAVYTGSLEGLVGTGYGSLVLIKALLLAVALALGAVSFLVIRSPAGDAGRLRPRLPHLIETEALILTVVVFVATALGAQPPGADHAPADQATLAEVAEVFRPKMPTFETPTLEAMRESRAQMAAGGERTREAYLWSNFSHNAAGAILVVMSLWALADALGRPRWGYHWPLGFVVLAAFVYLRASANEGTWPLGAVPVWQVDAEGIQHRVAAGLVLGLGLAEWRVRGRRGGAIAFLLPALCAGGGILLLTHSHAAFQAKSAYLVQVTHTTMGALAALMAAARWLELRLGPPADRIAGAAASVAMLAIGLVLVFYREANVLLTAR